MFFSQNPFHTGSVKSIVILNKHALYPNHRCPTQKSLALRALRASPSQSLLGLPLSSRSVCFCQTCLSMLIKQLQHFMNRKLIIKPSTFLSLFATNLPASLSILTEYEQFCSFAKALVKRAKHFTKQHKAFV